MQKLLLADDHGLVRETIADYLRSQGGYQVSSAGSLDEAMQIETDHGPHDLILLDYAMPGMDALAGMARMQEHAGCPVAILSGTASADVARRALRAGAAGFVPKTLGPEMLIAAVNEMVGGGIYRPLDFLAESDDDASDVALTPRELDVLKGLSEGKANKEIARELEIQEVTVKLHVKTLSRKLNARNRTHAAMLGRDLGLV